MAKVVSVVMKTNTRADFLLIPSNTCYWPRKLRATEVQHQQGNAAKLALSEYQVKYANIYYLQDASLTKQDR